MNIKPILIVSGEPYSVFFEIFFKTIKSNNFKKYKKPIILIASKKLLIKQMSKLKYSFKINLITISKGKFEKNYLTNRKINLINVNFKFKKTFDKISTKSNLYIEKCFNLGLNLIKKNSVSGLINGPISKKHFLKKKFLGLTEYLADKTNKKENEVMLIYNKKLSVSPITTHLPLKNVNKKIKTKKIIKNVLLINSFFKKNFKIKPRFAITGLNPHCETTHSYNEEEKIIKPAVEILKKKKINIEGPNSADTIFLKKNINKFDVIIGMYHDQILAPFKALFGFNAINITLGLPFIRISPDHGTNNNMLGKNQSDPTSLKEALKFLNKAK